MEGYIVPDPLEKDKRNYHIVLIPRTNAARKKLNKASSRANIEGFYYKPRLFLQDLLAFSPDELAITTACIAGIIKDDDAIKQIFDPLARHFSESIFIEVQAHWDEAQVEANRRALELAKKYHVPIIAATDSHYIYPEQAQDRLDFLAGKHITYEDEGNFLLDYPDGDTLYDRFLKQGVLSPKQIENAIANTLIFTDCEDIEIDKSIKMPTIYPNKTPAEKTAILYNKIAQKFKTICKEDGLTEEEIAVRQAGIDEEMQVVRETEEINTADYFLFNDRLVTLAVNKYGGILTNSGRGSAGASYINRVLGITQIDRFNVKIPLFFERFMSTARLLEAHAMPDIDFNVATQEPFILAARELLGDKGCYPMLAYGTMREGEAFRNVCRKSGLQFEEFNEVAKNLDLYREDPKWKPLYDEAQKYIGTIVSASVVSCFLLFDGDIESEIGIVKLGENYCAMITSAEADQYKYLKDDFLVVSVWKLISETFQLLDKPIMTLRELLANLDDKVWELYARGMTCTLNQIDSEYATNLMLRYKAKTLEELQMFIAALRPSFDAWRTIFISRAPYKIGVPELDEVWKDTNSFLLFQESLMLFFSWLGVSPAESIGLIKKISKKKIHQEDFDALESSLKEQWIAKTGSDYKFDETWADIQGCMAYGFAAPHAYATAIDSLYCAYLKANYPYEYYTVALNNYDDDEERTAKLTEELAYFGIRVSPPKWGKSKDKYRYDKESKTITKSLKSIKYLNAAVAVELYDLAHTLKTDSFMDVLFALKDTSINSRQLDILLKVEFFSDFGNTVELCRMNEVFNFFKKGEAKTISKDKLPEAYIPLIAPYATDRGKDGKELKSWKLYPEKMKDLLYAFESHIRAANFPELDMKVRVQNSLDLLGYIGLATQKPEDRRKLIISDIMPMKSKTGNNIWGYRISTQSLGSGVTSRLTLYERDYRKQPVKRGDIVYAAKVQKNNRGYWELNSYQRI